MLVSLYPSYPTTSLGLQRNSRVCHTYDYIYCNDGSFGTFLRVTSNVTVPQGWEMRRTSTICSTTSTPKVYCDTLKIDTRHSLSLGSFIKVTSTYALKSMSQVNCTYIQLKIDKLKERVFNLIIFIRSISCVNVLRLLHRVNSLVSEIVYFYKNGIVIMDNVSRM